MMSGFKKFLMIEVAFPTLWTLQYSGDCNSNAGQENDELDQVDAAEADAMGMMDTGDLDAEMAAADMAGNDF